MKISLHKSGADEKMVIIEEGTIASAPNQKRRWCCTMGSSKIFKWLIIINISVLLFFWVYAILSLCQFESVLRSKDKVVFLDRYMDRQGVTFPENAAKIDFNDSSIVSDFRESEKSLDSLNEDKADRAAMAHDLKFFLHTITSIVKNFIENRNMTAKEATRIRDAANNSTILRRKLTLSNLTDYEAHMLKKFTKLTVLRNTITRKSRIRRTVKGGQDESGCNLEFSLELEKKEAIRVMVNPMRKVEGTPNEKNIVNNGENNVKTKECTFTFAYEKN